MTAIINTFTVKVKTEFVSLSVVGGRIASGLERGSTHDRRRRGVYISAGTRMEMYTSVWALWEMNARAGVNGDAFLRLDTPQAPLPDRSSSNGCFFTSAIMEIEARD